MHRFSCRTLAGALVVAALLAAPAAGAAQDGGTVRGTVRGTVTLTDNGGVVHGAVVLVVEAGQVGLSDEDGAFEIENIPAGSYEVLAQREHLTAGRQMITVVEGGTTTVDFELGLSPIHEDVTVTAATSGSETTFEAFNSVTTLDSFDIAGGASGTLGEALQNQPGIANRSFGPGSSRPVIRGFDGDRVLILQDGVRTGDLSSSSGDHGVSIDPNGAERIEVVRGPATLLYGSNAVGGLVNVITPHESYRDSLVDSTRAQFSIDAGSANSQAGTNANLQHAQGNLQVWAGGSTRRTGDYETPAGVVENSATRLTNGRAGIGWFGDRFFASGGFTLEDGRIGVPFASEFHGHHGEESHGDEDEEEEEEEADIRIASQRLAGRFDIGAQNLDNSVVDRFRVTMSAIDWNHDELEVEGPVENIGTRFRNRTYIVRAEVEQRPTERLTGKFGAWTQVRDFAAEGEEALAPPTDLTSFAAFAYEELNLGRMRLQFGGRFERNDYRTGLRPAGHEEDDDHGEEDEEGEHHGDEDEDEDEDDDEDHGDEDEEEGEHHDEDGLVAPDPRDRQFTGLSASVGLHTDLGAQTAFVANLTSSHRAPALEELYNFGPHVGNLSFEVGNPGLEAETTLGLDLSLRHRSDRVRGELNAYTYAIDNFIFGNPTGVVLDSLPLLDFLQGDSRFTGWDARGSVRLGGSAWATVGMGYVDARLTATSEPLPRIPPLRGTLSLDVPYGGFTLSPELEFAGGQDEVFGNETETDGYSVFNVRASYVWPRQHLAHILTFTGYNLTNALYRNHTSFIKDLAPEIGRGFKVGYSLRFF